MDIVSAVIVRNPLGFTATLRFTDPSKDVIMSRIGTDKPTKMRLYSAIEGYVRRGGFAG